MIFTGGEASLREDLLELINYAEDIGQVTGLLTDGIRLGEEGYFDDLLQTGLDHILILVEPGQESIWESIKMSAASDIYTTAHLTLTPENQASAHIYLERLSLLGVPSISLSAYSEELDKELVAAQEYAANLDMTLIWDTPVPFSHKNPFALEFKGRERPPGAGHAWLYVEPDGDVLPDQEINEVLGNLLRDSWDQVWQAALQRLD